MKPRLALSTSARLASVAVLVSAVCSYWEAPLAVAQVPPATASASASASAGATTSPSASAGTPAEAKKTGIPVPAYAWPTDPSPEPKDDEWAGATELEIATDMPTVWSPSIDGVTCTQRALREWMRITCTPPHEGTDDSLVGVIWGMAGDLSTVKGSFVLASTLARHEAPPTEIHEDLYRKMGASATVTFQLKPGSGLVLGIDQIGWDFNYDGDSNVFSRPGMLIDVSWALGEKAPTIAYR
jgi:hypothetical protein